MSLETYGRYQLLKKLATGGMAQIYLARQVGPEGFEKLLVVKRILPHLAENDEFITMFLDEARIAARLNHPNVVQIFDLGAQDDSFFIAMEFIHGEDVRRVWKHADKVGQPLPVPLICRMIIEACAGLDYAHKKLDAGGRPLNIVHRDISPQNILVSFEGGVKIVDFGIAKAADQATVTKSGVLKGKYSYMSPEQAAGQPIDCRTDIFALGVVLYELLTGTRLFKRATDIQTLNAVTECKVAAPSEVNDRIPKDLDGIVMKALAKDRTARYPEAKALGSALEGWLLANALPASTAQLADFMRGIYAERLEREQEEGRLLVESLDASKQEEAPGERATPSFESMKRPTKAMRATQSAARPRRDLEVTAAERAPSRSGSTSRRLVEQAASAQRPVPDPTPRGTQAHTEASMPTQSSGRRSPVAALVGVLFALAVVGVGVWLLNQPTTPARLRLESTPPGAMVKRGDTLLCTTPCARDDLAVGAFTLRLEKEGYEPLQRAVTLEPGVELALGMLTLQPAAAAVVKPPVVAETTLVTIDSEPPGAEVRLDGELVGVTPYARAMPAKTAVEVKLELENFQPLVEKLTVAEGAEDVRRYVLKALPKSAVKPPVTRPQPPVVEVKPPPVVSTAKGTVRFIVKPWAEVDCPGMGIKDTTPFPDKQVPAGRYVCTFTNPEYPAKSVTVQVKAEDTTKVPVNFLTEK